MVSFLNNYFAVLIFPYVTELEKVADALAVKVFWPGNRHKLSDVLNVALKISGLNHILPKITFGGFGIRALSLFFIMS
jgi:hypothetical protein